MSYTCIFTSHISFYLSVVCVLFTVTLSCAMVILKQSMCVAFLIPGLLVQDFYSIVHPLLFCVLIWSILRLNAVGLFIAVHFIFFGAVWASFFNHTVWGFDVIEVLSFYVIHIILLTSHTYTPLGSYASIFLIIILFRFTFVSSYHTFGDSYPTLINNHLNPPITIKCILCVVMVIYLYVNPSVIGPRHHHSSYTCVKGLLAPYHV